MKTFSIVEMAEKGIIVCPIGGQCFNPLCAFGCVNR